MFIKRMLGSVIRQAFGLKPPDLVIVLHPCKAIYVPIPKVACSSWKLLCTNVLGLQIPAGLGVHEVQLPQIPKRRMSSYPHYFKFGFVRNPWDRLFSCYADKITGNPGLSNYWYDKGVSRGFLHYKMFHATMSFTEFIEAVVKIPDEKANPHFRSQYTFLTDRSGKVLADYVGKIEEAAISFTYVLGRLRLSQKAVPHENRTARGNYLSNYTPRTVELVRQRYVKDVEMFEYDFEPSAGLEECA